MNDHMEINGTVSICLKNRAEQLASFNGTMQKQQHHWNHKMSLINPLSDNSNWVLRSILWGVALLIVFMMIYKVAFRKQVEKKVNCLDQAASAQRANSPLSAVDKYAACIGTSAGGKVAQSSQTSDTRPARCRYVGVWAASRGNVVYNITLGADGRFFAEPGSNTPPNATTITGAWSAAGNVLAWVYDSGPVWPPDINPVTAETADAFTLSEVNGSSTRYNLIERHTPAICSK